MRRTRLIGAIACAVGALRDRCPRSAPAAVQVGSSGWLWGNPLPQGNTIRALSFAGRAGLRGRRLRHAAPHDRRRRDVDRAAAAAPSPGLTEVQAIDGDSVFAGGGCVARRSDDGGATFKRLAFTPVESSCREQLAAGWFVTRTTGYLVLTDGTVLRTDNDGDTFAQRNPLPGTRAQSGTALPTDVVFLSDQAGLAATSDGHVYRTVDGASSWTLVSTTTRAVRSLTFVDALHGVAVGDGGLYLTTADGGTTWTPQDLGIGGLDLGSVRCVSADELPGDDEDRRPARAHRQRRGRAAARHAVARPGVRRGVRVADAHRRRRRDRRDRRLRRRRAARSRRSAAGSPGASSGCARAARPARRSRRARTARWRRPSTAARPGRAGNVSTSEDVFDVSFPTNLAGFALDTAGGLFRTRDGGATWRPLDTGSTQNAQAVVATSPTTVAPRRPARPAPLDGRRRHVLGRSATARVARARPLRRSTSRGARSSPGARARCSAPPTAAGPGARSAARGRRTVARKVDFVDARTGYWLGTDGRVWRTRDGGRRWTELLGIGTNDASGMVWSSATRGYLVISRFGDVATAVGLPAAHDRRRRDVAPAVRRLDADPGERDRDRPRRRRLPARRRRGPAVLAQRRRRRPREPADAERPRPRQPAVHDRGHRPPVARARQRAGDGQHAGAGVAPLAAPDGPHRRERRVHDELARAPGDDAASSPSGPETSAAPETAPRRWRCGWAPADRERRRARRHEGGPATGPPRDGARVECRADSSVRATGCEARSSGRAARRAIARSMATLHGPSRGRSSVG